MQSMHLAGLKSYPRGLPSSTFTDGGAGSSLNSRDSAALDSLLGRPFGERRDGHPSSWLRRIAYAPRQRRLLADGLVDFRTFLNPVECRKWVRTFPSDIVCVVGNLKDSATPEKSFVDLVQAGVLPFLFASDAKRVVFAFLTDRGEEGDLVGSPSSPGVVRALDHSLADIVALREALDFTTTAVNQRFNRPGRGRSEPTT